MGGLQGRHSGVAAGSGKDDVFLCAVMGVPALVCSAVTFGDVRTVVIPTVYGVAAIVQSPAAAHGAEADAAPLFHIDVVTGQSGMVVVNLRAVGQGGRGPASHGNAAAAAGKVLAGGAICLFGAVTAYEHLGPLCYGQLRGRIQEQSGHIVIGNGEAGVAVDGCRSVGGKEPHACVPVAGAFCAGNCNVGVYKGSGTGKYHAAHSVVVGCDSGVLNA